MQKNNFNKSFTLIEVMVAVFIFAIVFGISIMAVNFSTGKVQSKKPLTLTREVRNAMETISQKMNNANAHAIVGTEHIWGFRIIGTNEIKIASTDGGSPICFYIKKIGDSINMAQNNCSIWAPADDQYKAITSADVKIISFSIVEKYQVTGATFNPTQAPFAKIQITARDAKNPTDISDTNNITLQTAYEMDYQTIQKLKP